MRNKEKNSHNSWNVLVKEWNKYAKDKITEIFDEDLISLGDSLLELKNDINFEVDIMLAKNVFEHEEALKLYFSYKNQFNINKYGKEIYHFLYDKLDFFHVVHGINYLLAGQLPIFNKSEAFEVKKRRLIENDMKNLKQSDKILSELGFDENTLYGNPTDKHTKALIARETLKSVYHDLEMVLNMSVTKKYVPQLLQSLETKLINPVIASKYFNYNYKAYENNIINLLVSSLDTIDVKVKKEHLSKTLKKIIFEKMGSF